MTARDCAPEPALDVLVVSSVDLVRLPLRGKGGAEILVELPGGVVAHIEEA